MLFFQGSFKRNSLWFNIVMGWDSPMGLTHQARSTESLLHAPFDELFEFDLLRFDSQSIPRVLLSKAKR